MKSNPFEKILFVKSLIDLKLDTETVITGLLHDVIEDTDYDKDYIHQTFGEKISEFGSGIKITGGGSNVKNLDLLFKEYLEELESENPDNKDISIKCEYLPIKDITFKENLEDKREYATLVGLLKWPILNVENDNSLIGIKKSFTENFSNIWKGFFE